MIQHWKTSSGEDRYLARVHYYDDDGERKYHTLEVRNNKDMAEGDQKRLKLEVAQMKLRQEVKKNDGFATPETSDITICDLWQLYLSEHSPNYHETATNNDIFFSLRKRIIPFLGNDKIQEIRPLKIIQTLNKNHLGNGIEKCSANTCNKIHSNLKQMFQWAIASGYTEVNPMHQVPRVKKTAGERQKGIQKKNRLTKYQVDMFLIWLRKYNYWLFCHVYGLVSLGSRWGEHKALRVRHLISSSEGLKMLIAEAFVRPTSRFPELRIKACKNNDRRELVLSPNQERFFRTMVAGKQPEDFIFYDSLKDGAYPCKLRKQLNKAIEACNLPHLSPHALRGTFGTLLHEKGVSIEVVSHQLGHKDTKVTKEHYVDTTPKLIETARGKLDFDFPLNVVGGEK